MFWNDEITFTSLAKIFKGSMPTNIRKETGDGRIDADGSMLLKQKSKNIC